MIPYVKLLTLSIKLLTRPVANYVRQLSLQNNLHFKHQRTRKMMQGLGRWHFQTEQKIDRLLLGVQDQSFFIKRQNDEQALVRGIDCFTELFIYSLVISISAYEIVSAQLKGAAEKEEQQQHYAHIHSEVALLQQDTLATDQLVKKLEVEVAQLQQKSQGLAQEVRWDESGVVVQSVSELAHISHQAHLIQSLL